MTDKILRKDPKPYGYEMPDLKIDKDLVAQSSVVLAPLNGNLHQRYKLIINGAIDLGSAPHIVTSLANAWQGSLIKFGTDVAPTHATGVDGGEPLLGDAFLAGNNTNQVLIKAELWCMKNLERKFQFDCQIRNASGNRRAIGGANHTNDKTTNITSATLYFGGPFTGNVKLQAWPFE
jgi:hypothetical protein